MKKRESCFRWFGHVQRRAMNAFVRKSELIQVEALEGMKNGGGRPNITLLGVVKKMSIEEVT